MKNYFLKNSCQTLTRCLCLTFLLFLAGLTPTFADVPCTGAQTDPDTCTSQVTSPSDPTVKDVCANDINSSPLGCTANDVNLGYADNVVVPGTPTPITSCINGSTFAIQADFHINTSGGTTRYDYGIYFATDGDPNDDGALTGNCSVTQASGLPSPGNTDPFFQAVGEQDLSQGIGDDTCGDITSTGGNSPQIVTIKLPAVMCTAGELWYNPGSSPPVTGTCQATPPTGIVNPKHCVSLPTIETWQNNQSVKGKTNICHSPLKAGISGTTSKCRVDKTFGIPVTVEDAIVNVTKTANPTTVSEPGGSVTFTVTATNGAQSSNLTVTEITDDVYGNLGDGTATVTTNGCDGDGDSATVLHIGTILAPGGSASCTFTADVNGNAGSNHKDTVEVCGGSSSGGNDACGTDDALVSITDVNIPPSLTKDAIGFIIDETYKVQVNNLSTIDPLTVNTLKDDKFGDITVVHGVGISGSCPLTGDATNACEAVINTTCTTSTILGSSNTISVNDNKNCEFTGRYSNIGTHTNTVTGDTTDDDGVTGSPSDSATVIVIVQ